ncbi:hypothetical protein AB0M12_14300 [Nocardia vinacea]|uniref:hypothetical protein n=1 Tax=Nocardia vinacea TaxID=96468 RepID=UPI0034347067
MKIARSHMRSEDTDRVSTTTRLSRRTTVSAAICVAPMVVGLCAIGLFASQASSPLRVIGSAVLYAIASVFAGGLLGFLFGIPRALTSNVAPGTPDQAGIGHGARFAGNTNLEQISDWLTKIIVGVTLTQLGPIRDAAGQLFDAMAPSLGGGDIGAPFAGALVVCFATAGFISGWLLTRLYLGQALAAADIALELIDSANRAEDHGEITKARALRRQAAGVLSAVVAPSAALYEQVRYSEASGRDRTRKLEQLVASNRLLAQTSRLDHDAAAKLFDQGGDGDRVIAIALMQGDSTLTDIERLAHAIDEPRSAFEQYHALFALRLWLRTGAQLDAAQQTLLNRALANRYISSGTDRYELARDIRALLAECERSPK